MANDVAHAEADASLEPVQENCRGSNTATAPMAATTWWASLNSPTLIAAPMVLQSELAFRQMMRQHGAQLCYTPMITADMLLRDLDRVEEQALARRPPSAQKQRRRKHPQKSGEVEDDEEEDQQHPLAASQRLKHDATGGAQADGGGPTPSASSTCCSALRSWQVWKQRQRAVAFQRNSFDGGIVADDRPLFAQVAANTPEVFVRAALELQAAGGIDAVDLNLGCPQSRAERDNFGAFLLRDDLPLVCRMITAATQHPDLRLPVTVKIRRCSGPPSDTVAVVKALVAAGAQLVAIHGRPITMKNHQGAADHSHAAAARRELVNQQRQQQQRQQQQQHRQDQHESTTTTNTMPPSVRPTVPIIANGNIWSMVEAQTVLRETMCDGVMCASALLANPRLFSTETDHGDGGGGGGGGVGGGGGHTSDGSDVMATAIARCREYLAMARVHVPFHPKSIKDHLLTFLRRAVAPTWKRAPNSGTDAWADVWTVLGLSLIQI